MAYIFRLKVINHALVLPVMGTQLRLAVMVVRYILLVILMTQLFLTIRLLVPGQAAVPLVFTPMLLVVLITSILMKSGAFSSIIVIMVLLFMLVRATLAEQHILLTTIPWLRIVMVFMRTPGQRQLQIQLFVARRVWEAP